MTLEQSYKKIKPAIVAFVPKFFPHKKGDTKVPIFPPIIGTGFVIGDGFVVTNDHVLQAIKTLPKPPNCPKNTWPAICILLYLVPDKGVVEVTMDIIGAFKIDKTNFPDKGYYGPEKPDLAIIRVNMKDLPAVVVKYDYNEIREGREIATAGYPMGEETLLAPGYIHQLTPTLQKGIISAILPCECEMPHAFMVNVMAQGGASGSPVFLPETGEVVGVLYGGLTEPTLTSEEEKFDHKHCIGLPTNFSYIVPSYYLEPIIRDIHTKSELKVSADAPSFIERVETSESKSVEELVKGRYESWSG